MALSPKMFYGLNALTNQFHKFLRAYGKNNE